MLKSLNVLYSVLIAEGAISETKELDELIRVASRAKLLHEYEQEGSERRSGEGRLSMSQGKREIVFKYIQAILADTGKTLLNITGHDICPNGVTGTSIVSCANDISKRLPSVSEMYKSFPEKDLNPVTQAISFIVMDIIKRLYLKDATMSLVAAKNAIAERGFYYKTKTAIAFLKLSPDYRNVYISEKDFEEAAEDFMLKFARKLMSEGKYQKITAQILIDEFQRAYPDHNLDPATAIRVYSYLRREASNDWEPLITEIVVDQLTRVGGKLNAEELMSLFYEKYPSFLKKPKSFFNTFLSDLKKHFKYYIADIILELSEEGLSSTVISNYLSAGLNYDFTGTNVNLILRNLKSGIPIVKKPPTEELPDYVNFDDRRVMEHEDTKRHLFENFLDSLVEKAKTMDLKNNSLERVRSFLIRGPILAADNYGLPKEEVAKLIEEFKGTIEDILKERFNLLDL